MDPRNKHSVYLNRNRTIEGINTPIKPAGQKTLVKKHDPRKFTFNLKNKIIILIVAILAFVGISWWWIARNRNPIPQSIRSTAGFPVYYPDKLPKYFRLDNSSIKSENGVVRFTLRNGGQSITVNEQKEPVPPPDLNALTQTNNNFGSVGGSLPANTQNLFGGFEKISTPLGQAVQGNGSKNNPIVIVSTDTTLINISGSQNLSGDLLVQMINALKTQ